MDLSQFSNGLTDREFEQKIRAENQTGNQSAERESLVASFEQYGPDTGFETAAASNERTRRSEHLEQQGEETGDQSFGMAV